MTLFSGLANRVGNMKIRNKLIIAYVISTLIPILILGTVLTYRIRNMSINRAITEANTNNDRVKVRLDELLRTVTDVSDRIYLDKQLQEIVTKRYKSTWEVVEAYSGYKEFDDLLRSYKEIKSIRFYADNETLLNNSQIINATPDIASQAWYVKTVENNGRLLWQYVEDKNSHENNLCLTRFIKNKYGEKVGVLLITVNNEQLRSLIEEEPFETLVSMDKADTAILYGNSSNTKMEIQDISVLYTDTGSNSIDFNNERMIVIKGKFQPNKSDNMFYVFTLLPVHVITSTANQVGLMGLMIIAVCVCIALIFILCFSGAFSKRIILLRKEMNRVVNGDFNISSSIRGSDEIGQLFKDLQAMIQGIKALIHEVYEEKLLKEQLKNKQKEIEFKMLASQINPHFLYNALETIRMEAHYNKQDRIAGIVKTLGKMLRRNLEVSNRLVTLESEIELVENYLYIQKFRFEEKVSYKIELNTDISDCYILPLLLQPIVENAFVHGLENTTENGIISVKIEKDDQFLRLEVEDNGAGMDEDRLSLMKKRLENNEESDGKNIGLCNINNRIKLYYGDRYGLEICSKLKKGTKVSINLPARWETHAKIINS